jgi:hypothetical protein
MYKEDEELLARVAKEKPELLDANIDEEHFHEVVGKLIKTPPAPKQKRRISRTGSKSR